MIIYLGNNLSLHGNTPSSIETLGKLLGQRYDVRRFSSKRNQISRWLDMMQAIVRHQGNISVVLIDTYSTLGFYYALGAACVCNFFSIPYMPILRGGNLAGRLENNPRLSRFVFGGAKLLIAPSHYLFSSFKDFGFTNIAYIPNSIEMDIYPFKHRKLVTPRLLWVRSFHSIYNPIMAIEVVQRLKVYFPDTELCMVGPDKDGSLLQCKAFVKANGLEANIKFTGVLLKRDWHALSKNYDIFINTTTVDNTPVSVIESMALGLPVISTNVGGIPFLITDTENGLLVPSGDVSAMVDKIKWLIDNPINAYQIALQARNDVEKFNWNLVKHTWFSILDGLEFSSNNPN
ncbi:MAG TPA: glycosyltransferase family 4 protein [Chryseolinea sp.]|nr:glycosyltransferase family 4 protein [Chryseolinea sp.]HPM30082.1 glycosyltransferase family 4 protein [Chryseolinea sp.]